MALVIEGQADFSQAQRSIDDFAKKSRIALTNLSLVVQDLPYGFIGIQNNLPALTQSFAQLSSEAGGTQNALKQIAAGLVGPAGLFLAFSAVTSAVTFAVQKYGSLNAAIDALVFGYRTLTKEQKEIAANVAQEGTKVLTLYSLYQNLDGERTKQYEIIKKLNDISPEYFGNLDSEKTKIDELKGSIDRYIDSFIGKIYIETQQKKITELITKYAEKISFVIDKEIELDKQRERSNNRIKNFIRDTELLAKAQRGAGDIAIGLNQPVIKQTSQEVIDQLRSQLRASVEEVFRSVGKFKNFIDIGEIFGDPAKSKKIKEKVDYMTTWVIPNLLKKNRKDVKLEIIPEFKFEAPRMELSPMMKALEIQQKLLAEKFMNMKALMEEIFFNPVQELFTNFFQTGKFAFKEFGDAVLKEIQRVVARIIATKIISLLASILVPGGSAAATAFGLKSVSTNALFDFLGGGVANPSFGGVRAGDMGMNGQVALVLRGQDLVGAINRTNTTINRVG